MSIENVCFMGESYDNNNDNKFHDNRANDNSVGRYYEDTQSMEKDSETLHRNNILNMNPTYRFKFTQEFMDALFQFSKVHQYDDRHSFKEAWTQWIETNTNLVSEEIQRLTNLDYKGNIEEKMFISARYYYRKKGTEKKAPLDRRPYLCSQKDLLDAMDHHIKEHKLKPSIGFNDFCENNIELLKTEIKYMLQLGFKDSHEIREKIKKTYKNRYFLCIKH
jgi:hypothetical protein